MEKTQFETLMLAITGLDAKLCAKIDFSITGLDSKLCAKIDRLEGKVVQLEGKMDQGFIQVRKDIETLALQMSRTVTDVNELKKRVDPSPSA